MAARGGLVIVPAAIARFALFPGTRIDRPTVGVLLVTGAGWMWLNNRALRLGDHLLHQTRAAALVVLCLSCVVDATHGMPCYDDGRGIVPEDHDKLGLAFHSVDAR